MSDTPTDYRATLNLPDQGAKLVAEVTAGFDEARAEAATVTTPKKVLFILSLQGGRVMAGGAGTEAESIIALAGGVNAATGFDGYKPMTDEALIAIDPDVIVVMTEGLESAGGVDGLLEGVPSVALTTAGKNRRIIDVDDTALFAGGTRIPDVLDGLARALYAPDSLPGKQSSAE